MTTNFGNAKKFSIMNEKALDLFIAKYGEEKYDLRVVKLGKNLSAPDFYWVNHVNGKPVLSKALQVNSGKGEKANNITEGKFLEHFFEEQDFREMKDIEKISDRVYMSNPDQGQQRFKILRVFDEKKARDILNVDYKLDFAIIRSGFDCFPAFTDARGKKFMVTIWDAKPLPVGDIVKIYKPGDVILGGYLTVMSNPKNGELFLSWQS